MEKKRSEKYRKKCLKKYKYMIETCGKCLCPKKCETLTEESLKAFKAKCEAIPKRIENPSL